MSRMIRIIACLALAPFFLAAAVPAEPGPPAAEALIKLKYEHFDPLAGLPRVPSALAAARGNTVMLVQVEGPLPGSRFAALESAGALILGYVPD